MKKILYFITVLICIQPVKASEFKGKVKLIPDGCKTQKFCTLAEDFGFIDKWGIGWQADAGDKTDGASIPKWAQRFAGVPYTPKYIKAAVLHDHYSKSVRPVRGWYETQRMFHEVLLKSGVEKKRAALLFAGVLVGSGKWITKMEGKSCATNDICYNTTAIVTLQREDESYDSEAYKKSFQQLAEKIATIPNLTEDKILQLTKEVKPNSIYLNNLSGEIRVNLDQFPNNTFIK